MTTLTVPLFQWPSLEDTRPPSPPKDDWPLMCDVATIRAGVPEALIYWRKAEGKSPPLPSNR